MSAVNRRFADHRWVGDKRSQIVHDLDHVTDGCALDDLVVAESYLVFAPDRLSEARNRGYRPCPRCRQPDGD